MVYAPTVEHVGCLQVNRFKPIKPMLLIQSFTDSELSKFNDFYRLSFVLEGGLWQPNRASLFFKLTLSSFVYTTLSAFGEGFRVQIKLNIWDHIYQDCLLPMSVPVYLGFPARVSHASNLVCLMLLSK